MTGIWEAFVTSPAGNRVAQVDVFDSLSAIARVNDVSTWELHLPTDTEAGAEFVNTPTSRLEIRLNSEVWLSGPSTRIEREIDDTGDFLIVNGADDMVWLTRRNAHPAPLVAGPTPHYSPAYDVYDGSLSNALRYFVNRNAGPSAYSARVVPGLACPALSSFGPTVHIEMRWQNLMTALQDIANPTTYQFFITDLTFGVKNTVDSGAVFAMDLGNLASCKATWEVPKTNFVVVGAGGEGTSRFITERGDYTSPNGIPTLGRFESFADRRDTVDGDEEARTGNAKLADGARPLRFEFEVIDTPSQAFGTDWNLGENVTVRIGDVAIEDRVNEVRLELDRDGARISTTVGGSTGDPRVWRQLTWVDQRIRQLERI